MTENQSIRFDRNLPRTDRTQHRLSLIEGEREGIVKGVLRDGVAPTPVMTKPCPVCNKPSRITNKGWVCSLCMVVF